MAKRKTAPKKRIPTERMTRRQVQKYSKTFRKAMIKVIYCPEKVRRYYKRLHEIIHTMRKTQVPGYKWTISAVDALHVFIMAEDTMTTIFGDDLKAGIERKANVVLPFGRRMINVGTLPPLTL